MPGAIIPPRKGDPLSARWGEEITEAANREFGSDDPQDVTSRGVQSTRRRKPRLGIWKLTSGFSAAAGDSSSSGSPTYGWARAEAEPVYYFPYDNEWDTGASDDHSVYIWHSAGYETSMRDDLVAEGVHQAKYGTGDIVWAVFNPQSEKWELLDGFASELRFELKTDLVVGGSATVYLVWYDSGYTTDAALTFTVYDYLGHYGVGRDNAGGEDGAKGYMRYFPDRGWEVVAMNCGPDAASSSSSGA